MMIVVWSLAAASEPSEDIAEEILILSDRPSKIERGERVADPSPDTSVYVLTNRDIEATPGSLQDIVRAAHALPGVVSDGDFFAGFHVRGGEQNEVVYVLDGVPLDNPFHLGGFNSVFHPDLVRELRFMASAPSAEIPGATSAVLDVQMWDGACADQGPGCEGVDGSVSVDLLSARGFVAGPVDRQGRLHLALGVRRSFAEAYFAGLSALNVLDQAFVAPSFYEGSLRAAWRPHPRHRVRLTVMHTGDGMSLEDSEDDAAFELQGAFDLKSRFSLGSVEHRYVGPGVRLRTTLAWTEDRALSDRQLERDTLLSDTVLSRGFGRSDVEIDVGPSAVWMMGVQGSRSRLDSDGMVQDQRSFPTWASAGLGAYGFQVVDLGERSDRWVRGAGYAQLKLKADVGEPLAEGRLQPGVRARAGIRVQAQGLASGVQISPTAGVSVVLPTGTIPKVTYGAYQRVENNPFIRADGFGNPDLPAEESEHLVVGVDQALPGGETGTGVVRVEAYRIRGERLRVNPDVVGGTFSGSGSARTRGLDVMWAMKRGPVSWQVAWGWMKTRRFNPLNTVYPDEVAPIQDQTHTVQLTSVAELSDRWTLFGRYGFHTGRPISEVAVRDTNWGTLGIQELNGARLPPVHAVDVRVEWSRPTRRTQWMLFAEVLNVGNVKSVYLPSFEATGDSVETRFVRHLPMRPVIGAELSF